MKSNEIDYDFTKCPYNSSHKFDSAKYFTHLGRCKDGHKVRHLYQTCQYNSLHIFSKQDIDEHQLMCPDRFPSIKKKGQLKQVLQQCQNAKSQIYKPIPKNIIHQIELQECLDDCVCILKQIQPILIKLTKNKRKKLKKLLKQYRLIWAKEQQNRRRYGKPQQI